jgi:uncharacterized protein YciI
MKSLITLALFLGLSYQSYSQEVFTYDEGDTTYTMQKYFLCFLKKGPLRDMDSLQVALIQEQHMNYLNKLDKDGHISMAGPFEGDGDIRGIVVYHVATKQEAYDLAIADPAVQKGRLIVDIIPWWAAKGSRLK